jgi:hypothetical protein
MFHYTTYTTWRILRFKCHLKRKVCHVVLCTNREFNIQLKAYPGSRGLFLLFSLRRGDEK